MDSFFVSVLIMAMSVAGAFIAFMVILLNRNKRK